MVRFVTIFGVIGLLSTIPAGRTAGLDDCSQYGVWKGQGTVLDVDTKLADIDQKMTKFKESLNSSSMDFSNFRCDDAEQDMDEQAIRDKFTVEGSCVREANIFMLKCMLQTMTDARYTSIDDASKGLTADAGNSDTSVYDPSVVRESRADSYKIFRDAHADDAFADSSDADYEDDQSDGGRANYLVTGKYDAKFWNIIVSGGQEYCTDILPNFPLMSAWMKKTNPNYSAVREVRDYCVKLRHTIKKERKRCIYIIYGDISRFPKPASKSWKGKFPSQDVKLCWYFSIMKRTGVVRPPKLPRSPNSVSKMPKVGKSKYATGGPYAHKEAPRPGNPDGGSQPKKKPKNKQPKKYSNTASTSIEAPSSGATSAAPATKSKGKGKGKKKKPKGKGKRRG